MTLIRASTGETRLSGVPAPPKAPAPEDFPVVPALEPPRLERADQAGLVAAITAAIAVSAGLKWLSAGSIESAPILFVAVVAAAWWLDRRASIAVAIVSETAWTAAAFAAGLMVGTAVSAVALGAGLIAVVLFVSAARERERALRIEELRREQARMILAVQLRESVVSIDVAVPLLADPMKLDRAQGAPPSSSRSPNSASRTIARRSSRPRRRCRRSRIPSGFASSSTTCCRTR